MTAQGCVNCGGQKAAESCGIGQNMFQLYELGVQDNPSFKQLEKIAGGFGLAVSDLIAPTPTNRKPKRAKNG